MSADCSRLAVGQTDRFQSLELPAQPGDLKLPTHMEPLEPLRSSGDAMANPHLLTYPPCGGFAEQGSLVFSCEVEAW